MWHKLVLAYAPFIRLTGRILLLGDGTKIPREARRMPGVKKLYQESEDSSKPGGIHGHLFGAIGAVIGNLSKVFCIPLDPLLVVEAYAKRFNIECMFRELKQQVAGFGYHF